MSELITKAEKAKEASLSLGKKTTEQKNEALIKISEQLIEQSTYIVKENEKDIAQAKESGMCSAFIDRLILNDQRIINMAKVLEQLAGFSDLIGEVLESWTQPNGLNIQKVRVPLGVVGMIYEARPNVTVDAASLCIKTGNSVLLRGSTSAIHSNIALAQVIREALEKTDLPKDAVQLLEDTSRETTSKMFKLREYLDVLIPRGGEELIQTVVQQASVPVLETGAGNCHVYIDETADPQMAIDIVINAKTQRPSVCNAVETIIVHEKWADLHLSELLQNLQDHHVELRADDKARELVLGLSPADETDWKTEYLDRILAVKTVSNVSQAIYHINQYGTKHSEVIVSESKDHVKEFFNSVDAAVLYHNASTRFTDGFEFGFGAEIGISTQKLHARGPMGLPALTSMKYIVQGTGQIRV